MKRVLIFGNSGSGKSTLARARCESDGLAHLDLDVLAWEPGTPPRRKALPASTAAMDEFTRRHDGWVIEGCYADLLAHVIPLANEVIFLDLPVEDCIRNARGRPWEPHKYASKAAQDANLDMLVDWIAAYTERDDTFSRHAHQALFEQFNGDKKKYTDNQHDEYAKSGPDAQARQSD